MRSGQLKAVDRGPVEMPRSGVRRNSLMAMLSGGKVEYTASIEPSEQWEAKKKLLRSAAPRHFADLG